MDYQKLRATYNELLERIDQYFDRELMQDTRTVANLEMYKDELHQELQIQLWLSHKKPSYQSYTPVALIWLKAETAWINFIRKLGKQSTHSKYAEFETLPEDAFVSSFIGNFETRDTVAAIGTLLNEKELALLRYRLQGYSYKEIKKLGNYLSEEAAKTHFNRLKQIIRNRFGRF